mgnify:CR=1 FL=1
MGNYLMQSVFELLETVLSYLSNTISFLRVGAFVIVHASMMMVVFTLAGTPNNIVVVILGNLVVICLEALLSAIQGIRLEFYEMFSRCYKGGGRKFVAFDLKKAKSVRCAVGAGHARPSALRSDPLTGGCHSAAGRTHPDPLLCSSSMLPAELLHKVDQLVDALGRHGVVDGRTHTAHQTVTLQVDEACLGAAAQNALSVSASGLVKVTFIMLRYFFSTGFL